MENQEYFLDLMEGDQNNPNVQYEIGRCYLQGIGVEDDGAQAEFWLQKAADQGQEDAIALLNSIREPEKSKPQAVTADNLLDFCASAEEGDPDAQYKVALYFKKEKFPGAEGDIQRYLSMAASHGHPQACNVLGEELLNTDPQEAVRHLRNAADCGLPRAMNLLAECYAAGRGVPADPVQAEEWFKRAADRGTAQDKLKLAVRFFYGKGVIQSQGKAMAWVKKAQDAGMANAMKQFEAKKKSLSIQWERDEKNRLVKAVKVQREDLRQQQLGMTKKERAAMEQLLLQGRKAKKASLGPARLKKEGMMEAQMNARIGPMVSYNHKGKRKEGYLKKFQNPELTWENREKAENYNRLFQQDFVSQLQEYPQWKELKERAAENSTALWVWGRALFYGIEKPNLFIAKDFRKMFSNFSKSAELGDLNGQYWLGWAYAAPWWAHKDMNLAEYWWMSAASQGHEASLKVLNQCIYNQTGQVADIQEWPFERK